MEMKEILRKQILLLKKGLKAPNIESKLEKEK
jgi:hypothetical protein